MVRCFPGLLAALLGIGNLACVSVATYEHDLATAKAETRVAQQSAALQVEAMRTALTALQRSLESEAELRKTTVRSLEEKLAHLERSQTPASATTAGAINNVDVLRVELQKMRDQEQESSARMRRIEEAIQRLSPPGSKPISASDIDVRNPWGKLHAYPY
jgi:chromosome segregation ATPase